MAEDEDRAVFEGECPWCGLSVDVGMEKPPIDHTRKCACGAVALGSAGGHYPRIIDAMIKYFDICPSPKIHDIYGDPRWLKDFHIQARHGGRSEEETTAVEVVWFWFKRKLPWEKPAGPMCDEDRLRWLESQGEKFYDQMYDSRRPNSEFREAREAFEDAVALAQRLGRKEDAARLDKRLKHITSVYRSQFDL
jgi:hypothetical protein